jgi:hypothetical protein
MTGRKTRLSSSATQAHGIFRYSVRRLWRPFLGLIVHYPKLIPSSPSSVSFVLFWFSSPGRAVQHSSVSNSNTRWAPVILHLAALAFRGDLSFSSFPHNHTNTHTYGSGLITKFDLLVSAFSSSLSCRTDAACQVMVFFFSFISSFFFLFFFSSFTQGRPEETHALATLGKDTYLSL